MAKKLKDTSDRYHTFREHAMKLKEKLKKKEEIEALNVQYRQQIQELEYKIQEITLKNTAVDFCMDTRREPEELIVKAPNLSSVCRPGAFGAKRRIETVGNTMEMVSNGMGGSRRARIDIPPLIPSPQVKMNLSTSGKTISKLTMLNKSNLALNSLPKKPSVMSKWLGRN